MTDVEKPIITGPGLYLTRDGRTVEITGPYPGADDVYHWESANYYYTRNGRIDDAETDIDIIAPLPAQPRDTADAKAALDRMIAEAEARGAALTAAAEEWLAARTAVIALPHTVPPSQEVMDGVARLANAEIALAAAIHRRDE